MTQWIPSAAVANEGSDGAGNRCGARVLVRVRMRDGRRGRRQERLSEHFLYIFKLGGGAKCS